MNGDRLDNRASNLTWGTRSENAFDRNRHGTGSRGEGNPRAKITEAQAIEILKMSPKPKGAEVRAIADRLGVDPDSIYRILNGQRWGYLRPLVGEK